MKKILLSVLTATLFAVNAFAQSDMKEGHVNYAITVTGNEQASEAMNGSTMSITVKDSMTKIDMNTSMMQSSSIANGNAKKGTTLIDMMGNKYAITLSPDDIKTQAETAAAAYDVKYVDSTKVIAGHVCKKAIITTKKDKKQITVWYAPDLKITIPMADKYMYSKIDGLLLEWEMEQGPINLKFTCTSIDNKPVDASVFAIPDGYTTMTMDQFKQAMSGMGGH